MLLDRHYSAVAFLGQYARANTPGGVMAHSYSSPGSQNLLMNGQPTGEIETRTALAGWFDTPVIFLSGDRAAAEQLKAIDPDAETAVVKEGIDNYACISLSADAARRLIRERAAATLKPGAEIIDARTIRFHGKDFFEAWQ